VIKHCLGILHVLAVLEEEEEVTASLPS